MRKERNNFFNESSYTQGYYYNQVPMMPQMEASSSFYMNQGIYDQNEINSRLSRLERQVNRLESRINKLENIKPTTDENITDINTNMYML